MNGSIKISYEILGGLEAAPRSPASQELAPHEVVLLLLELDQAVQEEGFQNVLEQFEALRTRKVRELDENDENRANSEALKWEEESNELFAKGLTKVTSLE